MGSRVRLIVEIPAEQSISELIKAQRGLCAGCRQDIAASKTAKAKFCPSGPQHSSTFAPFCQYWKCFFFDLRQQFLTLWLTLSLDDWGISILETHLPSNPPLWATAPAFSLSEKTLMSFANYIECVSLDQGRATMHGGKSSQLYLWERRSPLPFLWCKWWMNICLRYRQRKGVLTLGSAIVINA